MGSDFVNCLVVAVVDAVAAFDALGVIDGEFLCFFHNGTVGALRLAGTAFDATLGNTSRFGEDTKHNFFGKKKK